MMNQYSMFCSILCTRQVSCALMAVIMASASGCNSDSDLSTPAAQVQTKQQSAETLSGQETELSPDFLIAIETGNVERLSALILNASVNSSDKNGNTPLMLTLIYKKKNCFDLLLANGASINQKSQLGESAVSLAAYIADDDYWLKKLLLKGANSNIVNSKDPDFISMNPEALPFHSMDPDATPLFDAVYANSVHNVQLLFDAGANIDHKDGNGESVLIRAVAMMNFEAAYLLIKLGADLDSQNIDGQTARGLLAGIDKGLIIDLFGKTEEERAANEAAMKMWYQKVQKLVNEK